MKVYCMRHGEAESSENHPERPLTSAGKAEIQRLAAFLQQNKIKVDHLLHSQKLRAMQTAEIISQALDIKKVTACPAILNEEAEIAPIKELLYVDQENIMLVGHLPFLYKLVNDLLIDNEDFFPLINFFPGTIVCLEHCDPQWMINWIVHPKII